MIVIEKTTIAINIRVDAFFKNLIDFTGIQTFDELSPKCILNVMNRPQDLIDTIEVNDQAGFEMVAFTKAAMISRMPILRCNYQIKFLLFFIDEWNDRIPVLHW